MSTLIAPLDLGFYLCYNAGAFVETSLLGCGVNLSMRHPLVLNVGFLLHQGVGTTREFDFDHAVVQVGDDLAVADLQGSLRFTRTAQGLYAQGRLQAKATIECVRCLAEFSQSLALALGDLFVYPPTQATDPLLAVPETGILDLRPLAREHLLLDFPIQPLCRPSCQGLCAVCGENRNESRCDHGEDHIDPRLAALKSLLRDA